MIARDALELPDRRVRLDPERCLRGHRVLAEVFLDDGGTISFRHFSEEDVLSSAAMKRREALVGADVAHPLGLAAGSDEILFAVKLHKFTGTLRARPLVRPRTSIATVFFGPSPRPAIQPKKPFMALTRPDGRL